MKERLGWSWLEIALVAVVTVISGYFFVTAVRTTDWIFPFIELVSAIAGIFSVVLCAKGKKSGFIFGLVNVVGYSITAFNAAYYGEVMLNILFYVPSNIVSYFLWSKHQNGSKKEVKCRKLSWNQIGLGAVGVVGITALYATGLSAIGGSVAGLDSLTTVLSIVATLLMAARYSEQWLCWIIVDIVTVVMWVVAGSPIMIVMWGAYLINAFHGYKLWLDKSNQV